MQKAYTRGGVITGGFSTFPKQGAKKPVWNLFYKQKKDMYNVGIKSFFL